MLKKGWLVHNAIRFGEKGIEAKRRELIAVYQRPWSLNIPQWKDVIDRYRKEPYGFSVNTDRAYLVADYLRERREPVTGSELADVCREQFEVRGAYKVGAALMPLQVTNLVNVETPSGVKYFWDKKVVPSTSLDLTTLKQEYEKAIFTTEELAKRAASNRPILYILKRLNEFPLAIDELTYDLMSTFPEVINNYFKGNPTLPITHLSELELMKTCTLSGGVNIGYSSDFMLRTKGLEKIFIEGPEKIERIQFVFRFINTNPGINDALIYKKCVGFNPTEVREFTDKLVESGLVERFPFIAKTGTQHSLNVYFTPTSGVTFETPPTVKLLIGLGQYGKDHRSILYHLSDYAGSTVDLKGLSDKTKLSPQRLAEVLRDFKNVLAKEKTAEVVIKDNDIKNAQRILEGDYGIIPATPKYTKSVKLEIKKVDELIQSYLESII